MDPASPSEAVIDVVTGGSFMLTFHFIPDAWAVSGD